MKMQMQGQFGGDRSSAYDGAFQTVGQNRILMKMGQHEATHEAAASVTASNTNSRLGPPIFQKGIMIVNQQSRTGVRL